MDNILETLRNGQIERQAQEFAGLIGPKLAPLAAGLFAAGLSQRDRIGRLLSDIFPTQTSTSQEENEENKCKRNNKR